MDKHKYAQVLAHNYSNLYSSFFFFLNVYYSYINLYYTVYNTYFINCILYILYIYKYLFLLSLSLSLQTLVCNIYSIILDKFSATPFFFHFLRFLNFNNNFFGTIIFYLKKVKIPYVYHTFTSECIFFFAKNNDERY